VPPAKKSQAGKAGPAAGKQLSRSSSKQRGNATGARSPGPSDRNKAAESKYLAELQRAIARHRYFPRKARRKGVEGVVTLYFVIEADGQIRDVRVSKSSGSAALDDAGLQTLKRLGRFAPIPDSIGRTRWPLRVPISFTLK
jgi:protein TonB